MSLFRLMATLGLDSSEYETGLENSERQAKGFGDKLKAGLATAGKLAAGAITAAAGAVTAFGAQAIQTGREFDSSMSQIAATLGITMSDIKDNVNGAGDTFKALRNKAQEMGAATNFSASQAADGLNILAMSGFNASDSISMVEDVLHLAAAGSMDMASAAGYLSGTIKGFSGEAEDAGYYADLMAKGATLANTSVSQLGEAMSSGAAGAAAYGQQADSMTVALLRLAEQGEVGSAAGTALAAAMKNLYTPTDQAKKALESLRVATYYTEEQAKIFNARMEDMGSPLRATAGQARDFNDVVNDLNKALNVLSDDGTAFYTEEQKNALKQTIFGIQGLDAYNKMTVTGIEKQRQWADALSHASDGAGETAKQYETMTDNLQGDLDILSSAFDGLKIAVSDTLMGSTREFVQFGSNALSSITEGFQEGGITGAMDALGTVLADGLDMILTKLPTLVEAGAKMVGAVVTGVIDNLDVLLDSALSIVTMLATSMAENPGALMDAVLSILETLGIWLTENVDLLVDSAVSMITSFAQMLTDPESIGRLVDAALRIIMALADGLFTALPQLLAAVPQIIVNLVTALIQNAPKLLAAGAELIGQLWGGIVSMWGQLVGDLPSLLEDIVKVFTETDWLSVGKSIIEGIWKGITSLGSGLVDAAKNIGKGLLDGIKGFFGIHSPSRVMRDQVGKMLGQGLAEGIDMSAAEAIRSAESMAEDVLGGIEPIGEIGSEFGTNVNSGAGIAGGYIGGGVVINVYGAEGQNVNELAEIISQKIAFGYRQEEMAWA